MMMDQDDEKISRNDNKPDDNLHARWMPGYVEERQPEQDVKPAETPIEAEAAPQTPMNEGVEEGDNRQSGGVIEKISLWLSAIFSPLLVPTYACAIALWITPLAMLSERTRLLLSLLIFAFTAAVPMATIIFMIRAGKVADSSISNRKERTIPYLVTLCCYLGAALFLWTKHAPLWLSNFFGGAAVAIIFALLVNNLLKWKISAHSSCMGGLCAMVYFIAAHHFGIVMMMPWLVGAMMLAGAVGSARLYLRRHTQAQVYAGFLMGLVVEYVAMSL